MANLIWAIICQRIITDRDSNSVSYIDALEGVGLLRFPSPLPPVTVGTLWQRTADNDSVAMRVRVLGPNGDVLHTEDGPVVQFGPGIRRYRVNMQVFGAEASEPGTYQVSLDQKQAGKWVELSRFPLEVQEASIPQLAVPA